MPTPRDDERSITRTYRTAIRIGEDFITLEETINLPIDASDEEVIQAVELGWRIYSAQREAIERQIAGVREAQPQPAPFTVRDPESPASDKQRNYIAALQDDLTWTSEQLTGYAGEQGVDLVTLTKGQASGFIDGLKKLAEERRSGYGESSAKAEPLSEKQHQALLKIAQARSLDLDAETGRRYGAAAAELSTEQARELIAEWQARPKAANGRKAEIAL
jgi:hypothetical protein